MQNPNCFQCRHKKSIPGDSHISCNHPNNTESFNGSFAPVLAILASVGRTQVVTAADNGLNIKASANGIRNGWFNYPYNFDPVWLENCDGFDAKNGE